MKVSDSILSNYVFHSRKYWILSSFSIHRQTDELPCTLDMSVESFIKAIEGKSVHIE